jgi:hypothetical protein
MGTLLQAEAKARGQTIDKRAGLLYDWLESAGLGHLQRKLMEFGLESIEDLADQDILTLQDMVRSTE